MVTDVGVTVLASLLCGTIATVWDWTLWKIALAVLIPWGPLFIAHTVRTARHYGWLALFFVLVVSQIVHLGEHTAQIMQIHVLSTQESSARGIFGHLNFEWVHFGWNSWVLVASLLLAWRFKLNRWLLVALAFAALHEAESLSIMRSFLATGVAVDRANLHFVINAVQTVLLVLAFSWQTRFVSDSWLVRAFPNADAKALLAASHHIRTRRFKRGDMIAPPASGPMPIAYVVARGQVEIESDLHSLRAVRLRQGHMFGAHGMPGTEFSGTIRACSTVELVELDAEAVRSLGGNGFVSANASA